MGFADGQKIEDIIFALEQIKDIKENVNVRDLTLINFDFDKKNYGGRLLKVDFVDGETESIELP